MKSTFFGILVLSVSLAGCAKHSLTNSEPSVRFEVQKLSDDYYEGSAVGDIDNDGDLDLVSGEYWYENPGFKTRHRIRTMEDAMPTWRQHNGDQLLDVDGDGDLDLVSGQYFKPEIMAYLNPGRPSDEPWESLALAHTHSAENEFFFYQDMDDKPPAEFVLNSWDPRVPVTVWTLQGEKPALTSITMDGVTNGHGMGFGDLDGDGDQDLLFSFGWYEKTESGWILHKDWNLPPAGCPILVSDIDGDGQNEVIAGAGHGYGLFWLKRDGNAWNQHTIDDSFSQAHTLTLCDLDGDGRAELITGKRYHAHNGKDPGAEEPPVLYYYKWVNDRFERHLIDQGQVGTGLQIQAADLNGDGKPEIFVAGKTGAYLLWNKGLRGTEGNQP